MECPTRMHCEITKRTRWEGQPVMDCLLELLPLPSPGLKHWSYGQYADCSRFPFLETRRKYKKHLAESRAMTIGSKIQEYKPKLVAFYGNTYRKWWGLIANGPVSPPDNFIASSPTSFVLLAHPNARKITESYFRKAGKAIAAAWG